MEQQKSERISNIELYRIVVTLFVLIVHFNGYFVGLDAKELNFFCIPQIVIESFTVIAVNGFIIISGYFGINNVYKSLWKLYKYMICITVPLMLGTAVYHDSISISQIVKAFLPFSQKENYFINGYIIMLLFSPFINQYTKYKGGYILNLIMLLIFAEFWFDNIWEVKTFGFNDGYSGLHFVVLYIIGRYLSCIKERLSNLTLKFLLFGYLCCSVVITLLCYFNINWALNYSNPLIILSAVFLFIAFLNMKPFINRTINSLASCSLFVYILQISSPFETYLSKLDKYYLQNYNYISYILFCLITILLFYLFCYVYCKIILHITNRIFSFIENKTKSLYSYYATK